MIRETDLVSYLPPFLAEYREINEALSAEDPEFGLVWKAADKALKNEFIATADEYGISRFEKMLGIFPMPGESTETRRQRVQLKWLAQAAGNPGGRTWAGRVPAGLSRGRDILYEAGASEPGR